MAINYRTQAPDILKEFLSFHENIQNHSKKTVDEYFLDLRVFFRFMKIQKQLVDPEVPFDEISIRDIDLDFIRSITKADIYDFLSYMGRDRELRPGSEEYGLEASSLSRKFATLRSFYDYLVVKQEYITINPMTGIPVPRQRKRLPRYLTEEECLRLLNAVDGPFAIRDYCILVLLLNCGLRVSELVGLNVTSIQGETIRVLGKGNKERILFLNPACQEALADYMAVRDISEVSDKEKNALFISKKHHRLSVDAVQSLLRKYLLRAGLDPSLYSPHKLRHTAATLMLQNGVDVRTLQEVLGHANLSTTQIYTHVDNENLRTAAKANPLGTVKKKDL